MRLHNPAAGRGASAGRHAPRLVVVGHDDSVEPCSAGTRMQQVEHEGAGRRVEVAGRFVGEHEPRIVRERAGDRDALLLAAAQAARAGAEPIAETDRVEQLARPGRPAAGAERARTSDASSTFSSAVSWPSRPKSWKTKPTTSRR